MKRSEKNMPSKAKINAVKLFIHNHNMNMIPDSLRNTATPLFRLQSDNDCLAAQPISLTTLCIV